MDINSTLITKAVMKLMNNFTSHRLSDSDRKWLGKIEINTATGEIHLKRIIPRKCNPDTCGCGELHWCIFEVPITAIEQKEKIKLFQLSYKVG